MVSDPVVPVVIDTNVLVPSLFTNTWILKFILNGNIIVPWNQFIKEEAMRIIAKLYQNHYQAYKEIDMQNLMDLLFLVLNPEDMVSEMPDDWPAASPDRKDRHRNRKKSPTVRPQERLDVGLFVSLSKSGASSAK